MLFQSGHEFGRAALNNTPALHSLLTRFVGYEPPEVQTFRNAIERFKADLPDLLTTLRPLIEQQAETNSAFAQKRDEFLELCQQSINPDLTLADVREMLIQHILTEDIFTSVFNESQFHQENNIARELQSVTSTFFIGMVRRNILGRIAPYVSVIRAAASNIVDHHEKQRFLKVVYENFYKAYNPAGADRLGIVYTPSEIVRFMIEGAEWLTEKHWGRLLGDHNVEILDPATGTGTFITELIDYLPAAALPHKYANEIHCNEVAILPYYIANLNIEYTYKQKMETFAEFTNICFVDTLDNLGFEFKGKQGMLFGLAAENLERIKRQNERTISVIIGNPPYNDSQHNENDNNKNRKYPGVDKRIKETYLKESTAQKTHLYDMYTRFYRWASDRLNQNGVLAFITNRSFIDSRNYDGFRKIVSNEFNEIYIVDLGGDVRKNPKLSGPKHNVFAIQTGVAICFMVKKQDTQSAPCRIFYACRPEMEMARDKLQFLSSTKLAAIPFTHINPDNRNNWVDQIQQNWDHLISIAAKGTKYATRQLDEKAIFRLYINGCKTNRDEWIFGLSPDALASKMAYFIGIYNQSTHDEFDPTIKWSRDLKLKTQRKSREQFNLQRVRQSEYRPFYRTYMYDSDVFIDVPGIADYMRESNNLVICFSGTSAAKSFQCLAVKFVPAFDFLEKTQCLPLYRYDDFGNRRDNITNWAVKQFHSHYGDVTITPLDIFHYVYAALHNPTYRTKYEINLKREFPRIPFYADFYRWAAWGKQLMDLHINYEAVEPYLLDRVDGPINANQPVPRPKLKADKTNNQIELDRVTTLRGVPPLAWTYKLGSRAALEWVLERYQETTPKDPTIAGRFNTYRFADYKEQVIDLLQRVCTVSIATMEIVAQMANQDQSSG